MTGRPLIVLLALISGAAFADSPARDDSLYARLGGMPKVTAFVGAAIEHADIADAAFARDRWVARICALSGGGCIAADDAMRGISPSIIEELRRAMRAQHVPLAARNELLDILAAPPRGVEGR